MGRVRISIKQDNIHRTDGRGASKIYLDVAFSLAQLAAYLSCSCSCNNMKTATDLDCLNVCAMLSVQVCECACVFECVKGHTLSGLWLKGSKSVCCMQLIAKDFMVAVPIGVAAVAAFAVAGDDDGDNAKIYNSIPIAPAGMGNMMACS